MTEDAIGARRESRKVIVLLKTDKDEVELNRHSAHRAASAMSLGPRRVVVREDRFRGPLVA
jgi:hypothetical protein